MIVSIYCVVANTYYNGASQGWKLFSSVNPVRQIDGSSRVATQPMEWQCHPPEVLRKDVILRVCRNPVRRFAIPPSQAIPIRLSPNDGHLCRSIDITLFSGCSDNEYLQAGNLYRLHLIEKPQLMKVTAKIKIDVWCRRGDSNSHRNSPTRP